MKLADLKGRNVVVWGLGREGLAALPFVLYSAPSKVFLIDNDPAARDAAINKFPKVEGAFDQSFDIPNGSVIVKSPGISRYDDAVIRAIANGCIVTSGTDLWLNQHDGENIIGVTGSKGKSTTAALIEHILQDQGINTQLGGNIGTPLIDIELFPEAWAVAEVSSFQAAETTMSPEIGVLTSLFPEHLDWHNGYENYVRDKLHLFETSKALFVDGTNGEVMNQTAGFANRKIVNASDSIAWHNSNAIYYNGTDLMPALDFTLHGGHNLNNVVLAIAAADNALGGLNSDKLRESLTSFRGLPHRLQHIGELNGALVIDDGLATNPGACVAALKMFSSKQIAIFLGGYDRGVSYDAVAEELINRNTPILGYLMGPAGEKIRQAFDKRGGNPLVFLQAIEQLKIGVQAISQNAQNYEVIILAPGGASFDEFENYEQRSEAFREEMIACGMKPTQ